MTHEDKLEAIRNLTGKVTAARDDQTWQYRGLILKKVSSGRKRGASTVVVIGPDGNRFREFDMKSHTTADIVELLDDIRMRANGIGKSN